MFNKLFGNKHSHHQQTDQESLEASLSDADYEFLFYQLLEGLSYGWHQGKVVKFFERLGDRGKQEKWIDWLNRFAEKMMQAPKIDEFVALRMIGLGQVSKGANSLEKIGEVSYALGQQLLQKNATVAEIWEYSGEDATNSSQSASSEDIEQEKGETLTLEELFVKLEQDNGLVATMAAQLGINTTEPKKIIDELIKQFNNLNTPDKVFFNNALEQAQKGDWLGALTSWDKALEINPNLSEAWHNRGNVLSNLERWPEAIISYDQAIAIDKNDYLSWNHRGNSLYNLQRWSDAIASWEETIKIRPDYYQAWYNRGCALEDLERLEESLASYNKALEIQPDFEAAQSRLNNLLKVMGKNSN